MLGLNLFLQVNLVWGSRVDEVGRGSEEYLHRVEISKPFYIADTEMTLKAWNRNYRWIRNLEKVIILYGI